MASTVEAFVRSISAWRGRGFSIVKRPAVVRQIRRVVYISILFIFGTTAQRVIGAPPELDTLIEKYKAALRNGNAVYDEQSDQLGRQYLEKLSEMSLRAAERGDLDEALQARTEKARFEQYRRFPVPDSFKTSVGLSTLR